MLFYGVIVLLLIKLLVIFCVQSHIFIRPISYKPLGGIQSILHEAKSIPKGDVHTLEVLQLHVILQSYGPFVGRSEALF